MTRIRPYSAISTTAPRTTLRSARWSTTPTRTGFNATSAENGFAPSEACTSSAPRLDHRGLSRSLGAHQQGRDLRERYQRNPSPADQSSHRSGRASSCTPEAAPGEDLRPRGSLCRSLAAQRPDLVAQLAFECNSPDLDPSRIAARSGKRLWWRCPDCAHVWEAAPHDRPTQRGCPICGQERRSASNSNRRVDFAKSLAARRPDLVAELHPTRNPDIDPRALGAGSEQKVWWLCASCGSEWQSEPSTRSQGHGCPACGRRRQAASARYLRARVPFERSIAAKRPALTRELHPTRNPNLDPSELAAYSNRVVWWLCPCCGTNWQAAPNDRHATGRCPACRSPASTANPLSGHPS